MDPSDLTPLVPALEVLAVLVTLGAGLVTIAGLVITATGRTSRARALGHPLVALVAAGAVVALAAAGQWVITHAAISNGFEATTDGWRRVATAPIDATAAMAAAASLQRFAAGCVATLVPLSWLAAWRYDPNRERSAVVASVAATFAMSLPVIAGCSGVAFVVDTMLAAPPAEAMWPAWHALEASKWAVAGIAAVALMAATPIVMHAASRGNVVSSRSSQLSQVMLLVGLAAWSTSRFANEDLVRGPMASLERGEGAWHRPLESRNLPTVHGTGMVLPTASRCSDTLIDPARHQVLQLQIDDYGTVTMPQWPSADDVDGRERVVVAAVDRRTEARRYEPALIRAQALGVHRIAIVTRRDDAESSLTLCTLYSQTPCVLGWIGMDHALRLSSAASQWTTLAYAASHPR